MKTVITAVTITADELQRRGRGIRPCRALANPSRGATTAQHIAGQANEPRMIEVDDARNCVLGAAPTSARAVRPGA